MKVMVIGSGGREHTIIKALKKSPEITALYALPGNGGIAADAPAFGRFTARGNKCAALHGEAVGINALALT